MLHRTFLSVLCLFLVPSFLSAQITSTLSAETGDNTSAVGPYNSTTGNASPANVSKLPLRSLLYPEANTRIYIHLQPWFCLSSTSTTCNGHIQVGYDSNSTTQVKNQIDDMISRGANGVISNWYGPYKTIENETTKKIMLDAQSRSPLFEFAIMADQGALNACRDGGYTQCDCWPAGSTNCTVTTHLISALNYANSTFYSSPAYMRRGGRPVVFFFIDESNAPPTGYAGLIDWSWVRANVQGNPLFVFRNNGGFTHAQSDGSFSWLSTDDQPMSLGYLNSFYDTAKSRTNNPQVFGSALKGYNEALASWTSSPPDKIEQFCGKTWLETWAEAGRNYSSSSQLANLQVVTWNDYEEGTEMESGIDNCLSVSAAVSGASLTWTLSGTGEDRTIDRYRIWSSPAADGQNLTLRYEAMGGTSRSVPLSSLNLAAGSYKLYVQAVGKPSIRNQMSGAVAYTVGACTSPGAVTVTTPTSGATVTSKVHVVASESSCRSADSMQIYLDHTKVFTEYDTDTIDTYVDANCGSHPFTVKAWYSDGTSQTASYTINVNRANIVSSPINGATVTSPVRVISTSCSNNPVTATQIYLDDRLVAETSTSTLDQSIAMPAGPHCLVGKGWDSAGNSFQTTRICFTVQ